MSRGYAGRGRPARIAKQDYEILARFRRDLRRFLHFSEEAARAQGITPQQHQLLLAVKGTPGRDWATVGELAAGLQLRHHSVVGIVDRSERAGLVERRAHAADRRVIEVHLTDRGAALLHRLTAVHRIELRRLGDIWQQLHEVLERDPE
jgi:DNA-binding MarR family transcriptional regulator